MFKEFRIERVVEMVVVGSKNEFASCGGVIRGQSVPPSNYNFMRDDDLIVNIIVSAYYDRHRVAHYIRFTVYIQASQAPLAFNASSHALPETPVEINDRQQCIMLVKDWRETLILVINESRSESLSVCRISTPRYVAQWYGRSWQDTVSAVRLLVHAHVVW